MDNQVSYSTINLSIEEVKQLTPVKEQSVGEKIATGFWKNLTRVGAGILNFVIGLIISIPYVLLWGIIIAIVVFIIRSVLKKNRSRKVSNKVSNKPEEEKEKQKNE